MIACSTLILSWPQNILFYVQMFKARNFHELPFSNIAAETIFTDQKKTSFQNRHAIFIVTSLRVCVCMCCDVCTYTHGSPDILTTESLPGSHQERTLRESQKGYKKLALWNTALDITHDLRPPLANKHPDSPNQWAKLSYLKTHLYSVNVHGTRSCMKTQVQGASGKQMAVRRRFLYHLRQLVVAAGRCLALSMHSVLSHWTLIASSNQVAAFQRVKVAGMCFMNIN